PSAVLTPGGNVSLDFTGLGAGPTKTVSGTIRLDILGFVSLEGSFSFQTFTDLVSGASDIAVAATGVKASLTVGDVSLVIDGASLGLLIIPGVAGGPSSYALVANGGTDTLTGVPGLSLSAAGLSVKINNTGFDIEARVGSTSLETPGGSVDLDFSDLGSGAVMSVEGSISLNIAGFVSLSGDFGFQKYTDTNTTQTRMLIGATNVNVTLGTADTNLTITGASLGLLILPGIGGGSSTYALVANGGDSALNGVPGLTLSATGLTVKINNTGLDPETLAAQAVHTPGGDVTLDFAGLGAGAVTQISGTVSLTVADFVSISGSFVFTKQVDPNNANITKIVVGASGVTTFLGTADQSVGVRISDAKLGLVIYKNTVANTSTYALYASTQIEAVGLPSEISLTGTASLMINNTGKAVSELITTPQGDVSVAFTDGTGGTADQRNVKTFSGGLTLTINAGSSFSLSGNFSFSKTGTGTATKILIGASDVSCSNILPDGGSASVSLTGGSLGLVLFSDASGGYAMTASATVAAGGGGSSASATVTIRRNATNHAVNESVNVGTGAVQVTFSGTEIKTSTTAFQSIALSDATLNIDNIFIITAGGGSTSVVGGVTTKTMTGVSLTVQDPGTGQVLFTISAGSASYITIVAGTVFDGITWTNGGTQIVLNDLSFSLGGYVTFTGNSVKIRHYTNASNVAINSFNFSQASIALYVDGAEMVAVQGNLAFHYSTTEGFVLDSTGAAPITGFSFLGQSIGDVSAPASSGTGNSPSAVPPPVTHTLGPITLGTPTIGFSNFKFALDGTLSVTVSISDTLASISGTVVSAAVKNITGSFTLGLKLDLANPFAAPTNVTASGFNLSVGQFEITIGVGSVSLKLVANNVKINPDAGPTNDLVSFGGTPALPGLIATLSVPGLSISGGASNFSIKGNGSFVAGNDFSVTLALGENSASSLKWPDWLPIKNVAITVEWPGGNFNTDPANFILDFSATVDLSSIKGIPLTVSGTINHVRIDIGKLADGEFPILSIESLAVSVTGNLFGGQVQGALLAGVVRFDANGAVVDSQGKLVSNGQPGVGEITSVFYGGISASFSFGGMAGFSLRLGLSQYGPLSVYVSAGVPILLDPNSGLSITNLRGGVTFGQGLPTLTISDPIQASDALQLRQPAFQTPATLTEAQWLAQMKAQVATLYKTGATDGWSNLGASTITIQAGATVYDAYVSANAFRVDADVFFDTSGKLLIIGSATFGNSLTLGVKIYTDLTPIFEGSVNSGTPVNILFLMDLPAQTGTPLSPPIVSIYGILQFAFTRVDGTPITASNQADAFQIDIAGAAQLNVLGGFQATLTGNISLTFTATNFQIVISNVNLNVGYLGDIGTAAGNLTIQKNASDGLDIWGGFLLVPNLTALESAGIHAVGQIYFQLNTTTEIKQVPLILTTGNVTLTV
ncbi:MAG: beta strand repeat-containing protein, partial [Verrucomicrobiota bacterium]